MKTLKSLIETYKTPKSEKGESDEGTRKPGETTPDRKFVGNTITSKKGNAPATTAAQQEFVDDHEVVVTPDANKNGDDVFKASKVKISSRKDRHGYDAKQSEDVNEKHLTAAEMKKREEVAKAIERENPNMPMSKKMAIATSTAKKVAEALDHSVKAKENADFHHGQATDYAKEIQNMLGDYKKHLKGEKHVGEYHAMDIAGVHGGLKQVHDQLKYAVMGIKPIKAVPMHESYESILDAVNAHKSSINEEQDMVDAYAVVLESIYESYETEEEKQAFMDLLESDDAFDQLVELVEEVIGDE